MSLSFSFHLPLSYFLPLVIPVTPPSCRLLFSRSPSLHLPLPLSVSLSFLFLLSTRLLCALPVSQRIPLVAQLRDSAGKLRLFKARSAGKASSCWKEAAWTWRTSPSCLHTLAHNTDTHTFRSEAQAFYYHVSLHFQPERCHSMSGFLSAFWLWTFVTETRATYFHRGTHSHARACCRGLMVSIFVN